MDRTTRAEISILVGFAVALLLLYVLVRFVGVDDVVLVLRSAQPTVVAAAFLLSLCWMAAWSYTLSLVFGVLEVPTTPWRSFLVYLNVIFANNIAPFSVGGGEPIAAIFVSRASRTNYETALLAVLGTDVLNYLPAPLFAILGLLYLAATQTLGKQIEVVMLSLAGVSILFVVVGALGWRYRNWIEHYVVAVLVTLQQFTRRVLPASMRPSPASLQNRVDTFVDGLERVASDRRVLMLGFGASALGWGFQASVLWLALRSVGLSVPVEVPIFVVTLVTVTDLVPVPGGIGSVDTALVGILVAVTNIPAPTATAAALLFRSATLLFPLVLGGAMVAVLQTTAVQGSIPSNER